MDACTVYVYTVSCLMMIAVMMIFYDGDSDIFDEDDNDVIFVCPTTSCNQSVMVTIIYPFLMM